MQKRNHAELRGRSSFSGKPRVLVVDRSSLDGRVLEELLRPMAEVSVRCNVWTAVKFIDSEGERLSAIFVEGQLLLSSSISDHWIKSARRTGPRIVALYDNKQDEIRQDLSRFGVVASVRKPYDDRLLAKLVRDFGAAKLST